MTTSKDDLEEHLECSICLEKFTEPKVLTCQHIFCKQCLEGLVTRVRKRYRRYIIRCPVCREKSQVLNGDVANLPSNYIINHLLDLRRTNSKPFCNKHEDEILKLFCLNCQQLICQDCALIDHRDHKYNFAKDVFPAEKEKIVNAMLESKEKVLALQGSMGAFEEQKKSLDQNAREVDQKIDDFFNEVIQFLKGEKQRMKDELKGAVKTQKENIHAELSYFEASLEYASSRLEVIEHLLAKVSDEDALLAKNDMLKQLSDINCVLPHLQPTPQTIYDFGADDRLDVINKMEAISLH